jgi:hypothetical protein
MAVILQGSQYELILTRSGTLSINNEGMATLSREYACSTDYEFTADAVLAIDSAADYLLPTGCINLICNSSTKARANGITTYSVNYIGVTNQVYRTTYGTSILSYSKRVTTSGVTDQYTGTYAAPTVTTYCIASSGGYVPSTPTSEYDIRILESYLNGAQGSEPSRTETWLLTSLKSTQIGTYYVIEATGTKTITG